FGPLRVINEDRVDPGAGFPTHGHRDMEIITYVIEGALEHKDSTGTGSVIRPGDIQRMSAGTGIRHSEFNASREDPVHFLQIWILPEREGLPPAYEEKTFGVPRRVGDLQLIGSRDGRDGSVTIHQDVDLYSATLLAGTSVLHKTKPDRKLWVQVVHGEVTVNGEKAEAGDGIAVTEQQEIRIVSDTATEFLLFDMG
ncbi:MAG: pirin family protein, partial [Pseudomonadota bacterium]